MINADVRKSLSPRRTLQGPSKSDVLPRTAKAWRSLGTIATKNDSDRTAHFSPTNTSNLPPVRPLYPVMPPLSASPFKGSATPANSIAPATFPAPATNLQTVDDQRAFQHGMRNALYRIAEEADHDSLASRKKRRNRRRLERRKRAKARRRLQD
jgi:hypothetical protein